MLIEINGVDGQYASIDPAYVIWAKVHERSDGGWVAVVRCSTGSGVCQSLSSEFGPFEDKADADAIVKRVTEEANAVQTVELSVERLSEFIEFMNCKLCNVAVRRDLIGAVEIVPSTDDGVWRVRVWVNGEPFLSQGFDSATAADELFDRLTR